MKNNLFLNLNLFILICSICLVTSCSKANDNVLSYEAAIEKLIEYNDNSDAYKSEHLSTIDTIIVALENEVNRNSKNKDAIYYLGIAVQTKLNNGSDIVNFDNISLENTKKISNIFKKLENEKNINPLFRYSQYSKLTQIWGNLAINYVLKGVPDSADYAFLEGKRQGAFPDANLEYCRNVLNSLEPNAILFVASEPELFNFMFVQCEENIRIDVSLVSLFYLQYHWYAKWLNFLPNLTQPINTNCSDKFLDKTFKEDSIYINKPQSAYIDGENVSFNINGRNLNKYLKPEEIIMLEIIKFNANKRTVYFNQTIAQTYTNILGLNNNVISEGIVYKIVPKADSVLNYNYTISNLKEKFIYKELKNKSNNTDRDFKVITEEYKTAFMQSILFNMQNNLDKETLSTLLNVYLEIFPDYNSKRTNEEIQILKAAKDSINSATLE